MYGYPTSIFPFCQVFSAQFLTVARSVPAHGQDELRGPGEMDGARRATGISPGDLATADYHCDLWPPL
jgi:hypothetical protein